MATDPQPGAPGGTLPEKPKLLGLPAEGASKGVFWLITGGGTIASLLIGWWLYGHAGRKPGGRTMAETVDA
jgi:hypothetical protein